VKAIDCLVNVDLGEQEPPPWMVRVKEDYFKGGASFFHSPELPELLEDMEANGVERAVLMSKIGKADDRAQRYAAERPDKFHLGVGGVNPLPVLKRLQVPMLVLYGELDSVVPPKVHKARMEQAVREAGRHDVTIREFARANHGFFEAITGGRGEQPNLGNFVAGYFEVRTDWVLALSQNGLSTSELQNP